MRVVVLLFVVLSSIATLFFYVCVPVCDVCVV